MEEIWGRKGGGVVGSQFTWKIQTYSMHTVNLPKIGPDHHHPPPTPTPLANKIIPYNSTLGKLMHHFCNRCIKNTEISGMLNYNPHPLSPPTFIIFP